MMNSILFFIFGATFLVLLLLRNADFKRICFWMTEATTRDTTLVTVHQQQNKRKKKGLKKKAFSNEKGGNKTEQFTGQVAQIFPCFPVFFLVGRV